ncbi:MAG: electron transport complex subunit E, partial [Oscillospiraceae bacterium]|nr:electron transport complex subunit E [Oscillospiraceae bacterium]
MSLAKEKLLPELTKGFLRENPVLRLVLGTCPTLAISTGVLGGLGMGVAATIVLLLSNVLISALRKAIPNKVRIPAYITIIAGLVTVVQLLVKAYVPAVDKSLGIYLPLITVNCIILGRADGYANRHSVAASLFDAL